MTHRLAGFLGILALPALFGFVIAADPLQTALQSIRPHQLRAHIAFLAHDQLEGRAPGTRGAEISASYIASQFTRAGVEALGGSYLQQVPLLGLNPIVERTGATFTRDGRTVALEHDIDFFAWSESGDSAAHVDAELVFVGYGVSASEHGWDDFDGRDLRGKVIMVLVGDPPAPPEEPLLFNGRAMTYYGRWTYKIEEARRRGAAGVIVVHETGDAGYPWSVVRTSWSGERMSLQSTDDDDGALHIAAWVTRTAADSLVRLADLDIAGLSTRAARRDFAPIATGIRVRIDAPARARHIDSANVWGIVRGSDPALRHEVVVYTAHYDHLGVGLTLNGDSIYNGAYDNASGVAALLEIAEGFALMQPRPARSIMFLATTAEEFGLLGAEHYIRHPAFPLDRTAAVINLDGVNLWGETEDVIVLGAERSSLGHVVQQRANTMSLRLISERSPERGLFFRSDHFPFARAGVPAIKIEHGTRFRNRPADWGERVLAAYDANGYHRPADEFDTGSDLTGAVQQARLALSVGFDVAQTDSVPDWYPGGEFQRPR